MTTPESEQVLRDLAGILQNFEGREYSGEITRGTLFFSDLGLASIDAVVLGEKLEAHYGRRLPFNRFIAEMRQRQVDDIEVGALSDFLAAALAEEA